MAHGYLVKLLHKEASIYSAGIEKHGLNPYAVSVMKMDGVDISGNSSNLVDEYMSIDMINPTIKILRQLVSDYCLNLK